MGVPACDAPRIRVAAVLPLGERIVLVRHSKDDRLYSLLPGGGVEPGETVAEALRREVREETGLECDLSRPLFISDAIDPAGARRPALHLTFLAEVTGGSMERPPRDPAIVGIDLVRPDELPGLDLRPPIARELAAAARSGFDIPAKYLGALWTAGP